jgi:hypothetical protein
MKSKPRFLPLFSSDSEMASRILRRVSPAEAEKFEAMGLWERRYDTRSGELIGYWMCAKRDDRDVPSAGWTPTAISGDEMEINAATVAFAGNRSRTVGLSEERRLERVKQGLPAEDHAERVQCKVLVFPHVGAAKGDILRVWPRAEKRGE